MLSLQKLTWINPLIWVHRSPDYPEETRRRALKQARALVVDWIKANPRGGSGTAITAWRNKVGGDRAPYIGYIARAAGCEDLLSRNQASILLDSLRGHGKFLSDPDVHHPTNHGLFVDLGLTLLADYVRGGAWSSSGRSYRGDVSRKPCETARLG
jgi:hypothetical protein